MREFPAWVEGGEPLSWRHYVAGLRHLARARARESLRAMGAMRIAQADPKEPVPMQWQRDMVTAAGWRA